MSEAITPPVDNGQPPATPPTDGGTPPPAETPPSGLPSGQTPPETYDGFALNDDLKAKFKDGKLNGRFSSMDDVLNKLKEAEDFKANTIRDQKDNNGQQEQQQQYQQSVDAVVTEILPTFLENGMVLTADMEAKLTADIKDPTKKELAIYKFRDEARAISDKINNAHTVAGGKEKYEAMQEWGKDNLSKEQQVVFTQDVNGSPEASAIAIEWLSSKYQTALDNGTVVPRVKGQPAFQGITPYADRRELYKDKDYIESPAGRRDTSAIATYKARLRATPDAVIYGR